MFRPQQQLDKQIMQEYQYTLYTDLDNFLGIFAETFTVAQMVSPDDPLYLIHLNRLITQLNLSKSIHYDIYQRSRQNYTINQYLDIKRQTQQILEQLLKELFPISNDEIEEKLYQYRQLQQKELEHLNFQQLKPGMAQNQQFNEQVLAELIQAIQETDYQYSQIKYGQPLIDARKESYKERVKMRQKIAKEKIQFYKDKQEKIIVSNNIRLHNEIKKNNLDDKNDDKNQSMDVEGEQQQNGVYQQLNNQINENSLQSNVSGENQPKGNNKKMEEELGHENQNKQGKAALQRDARSIDLQKTQDRKLDPQIIDSYKTDAHKTNAPKIDVHKRDAQKPEAQQADAPKIDDDNTNVPKTDAPKPEAGKMNACNANVPQTDSQQPKGHKQDDSNTNDPKTDALRPDAPRRDADKTKHKTE